jgi:hypothetical protein
LPVATGTAPLAVNSTTKVNNLNADTVDGLDTATTNTASAIVARDASGNFSAGTATLGGLSVGGGSNILGIFRGSVSINVNPIAASSLAISTGITVAGASVGDICLVNQPDIDNDLLSSCYVGSTNTVFIVIRNTSESNSETGNVDFKVIIIK